MEDGEVASREGKAEEQKREKYQEEREGGGPSRGNARLHRQRGSGVVSQFDETPRAAFYSEDSEVCEGRWRKVFGKKRQEIWGHETRFLDFLISLFSL